MTLWVVIHFLLKGSRVESEKHLFNLLRFIKIHAYSLKPWEYEPEKNIWHNLLFSLLSLCGKHCLNVNEETSYCSPWNSDFLDNIELNLIKGHFIFFKWNTLGLAFSLFRVVRHSVLFCTHRSSINLFSLVLGHIIFKYVVV